ncbi:MAG: 2-hydroxyacyl-CoA dehydratase [Deltaproteobacteria bacterium]|nr:2-hydroxyacyl-CoA dehydratase [Deltaproteobacteria bacterium]
MKRLKANKRMAGMIRNQVLYTRAAKALGRKVAWVTSGSPVEVLIANGIIPFYPENHAAVCTARGMATDLVEASEGMGYSRDLCAYFRVDLGSMDTGRTPLGRLVPPDLVLSCNNICGTVQNWFRVTADRYNVPHLFLDTPFSDDAPTETDIGYVRDQLLELTNQAALIAGRSFSKKRLLTVIRRSMEGLRRWDEVLKTAKQRPAPFTSFEAFVQMAPIVSMRGTRRTNRHYLKLLDELRTRRAAGVFAVDNEQARVVWDNIAIWPAHRELRKLFQENNVAMVADTYTGAWSSTHLEDDPEDPIGGLARAYTDIILNHGMEHRIKVISGLIQEYGAQGFVLHSNRSCKRYSLGQYLVEKEVTRLTGAAGIVIEADMADPRNVNFENLKQRLTPFFEMIKDSA